MRHPEARLGQELIERSFVSSAPLLDRLDQTARFPASQTTKAQCGKAELKLSF